MIFYLHITIKSVEEFNRRWWWCEKNYGNKEENKTIMDTRYDEMAKALRLNDITRRRYGARWVVTYISYNFMSCLTMNMLFNIATSPCINLVYIWTYGISQFANYMYFTGSEIWIARIEAFRSTIIMYRSVDGKTFLYYCTTSMYIFGRTKWRTTDWNILRIIETRKMKIQSPFYQTKMVHGRVETPHYIYYSSTP